MQFNYKCILAIFLIAICMGGCGVQKEQKNNNVIVINNLDKDVLISGEF